MVPMLFNMAGDDGKVEATFSTFPIVVLTGARLMGARLMGARVTGARLMGARLTGAACACD